MKYLLIYIIILHDQPATSMPAEFNSLAACKAAVVEMRRQAQKNNGSLSFPVLLCAEKGADVNAR